MRSWRSEVLSVATALALPALLAVLLPHQALTFRAREAPLALGKSFAKLIALDEPAFAAATSVAKSPLAARATRLNLPRFTIGELPEERMPSVALIADRAPPPPLPAPQLSATPYLPSAAAPRAVLPPPVAAPTIHGFTREELLELK